MSVKALIGKKAGMTSVFDDSGAMVGVTVVQVEPNHVLGLRNLGQRVGPLVVERRKHPVVFGVGEGEKEVPEVSRVCL